jgi:hypothetical protein
MLMRLTKLLLLVALALAWVFYSAERSKSDVVIKNDRGGDVLRYYAKYQYLQARGERVVIDGDCLSSCTLVLGLIAKNQRCFTRKARFGFHAAWDESGKTEVENPIGTAIFLAVYPPEILRWINKHGGLTSKVIYLKGKALAAIYAPCRR